MAAWTAREAAGYRAAADAQLLRRIATDAAARRGIYRLVDIARVVINKGSVASDPPSGQAT